MIQFATWNSEWATPTSRASAWALEYLRPDLDAGVFTEIRADMFGSWGGHLVAPAESWGYAGQHEQRRKVALWSARPWRDVDEVGHSELPPGRFIAGTTDTPFGPIRAIGVCVPWKDAHVRTGRRDAEPWSEHLEYLTHLRSGLRESSGLTSPLIVAGDLNQSLPRTRAPEHVYDQLAAAFDGFDVPTAGLRGRRALIDHVAISSQAGRQLSAVSVEVLEAVEGETHLSDHDAVRVQLAEAVDRRRASAEAESHFQNRR